MRCKFANYQVYYCDITKTTHCEGDAEDRKRCPFWSGGKK